jgi:GNAT superfamily N-acetyltransferase
MYDPITIRLAGMDDAEALANLRWRLKTEDSEMPLDNDFSAIFFETMREEGSRFVHWVADKDGVLIAIMSVEKVVKLPSPGDNQKQYWGYLTNCYTMPQYRSKGIGTRLLSAVKHWARAEGLEFLAVWPSDRSYNFYQRAAFNRPLDPLIFEIRSE